jgi:hypothetical protein
MVSLLRSFVGFVALASLLSAQQRPGDGELERGERERMRAEAKAKAGGKEVPEGEEKSEREEDLKNLTPEERLARNITSGAGAYCRFTTSVREGKLMPGQSGTLLVTATLQGAAVMPSPPPIELVAPSQQGVATIGALAVRPADIARLAPGYAGRPVYDNYVVFELPVTLSPEAQIGKKVPVVIDLKFDLYDGASAQPIGRFVDRATAEIEVGAEPKPIVSMPTAAAATPPVEALGAAPVEPAKPQPEAAPANPAAVGGSAMTSVVPNAAPPKAPDAGASESSLPPVADSDGLPLWPILAGGGLVLVLVLMLARKK